MHRFFPFSIFQIRFSYFFHFFSCKKNENREEFFLSFPLCWGKFRAFSTTHNFLLFVVKVFPSPFLLLLLRMFECHVIGRYNLWQRSLVCAFSFLPLSIFTVHCYYAIIRVKKIIYMEMEKSKSE